MEIELQIKKRLKARDDDGREASAGLSYLSTWLRIQQADRAALTSRSTYKREIDFTSHLISQWHAKLRSRLDLHVRHDVNVMRSPERIAFGP